MLTRVATRRSLGAVLLTSVVTVSACGGSANDATDASDATAASDAGGDAGAAGDACPALDTWQLAQQGYLDAIGDAPADELTSSPRLVDAGVRLGSLLLEAGREAEAFDCAADLEVGAAPRCERIEQLTASGPGGRSIVADLRAECG